MVNMIFSVSLLRSALSRMTDARNRQKKAEKERYRVSSIDPADSVGAGIAAGFDTFIFAVAVLFLMLELMLLVFAINIAFRCTTTIEERVVHVTMACTFTLPYLLGMVLLNSCARAVLARRTIPISQEPSIGV